MFLVIGITGHVGGATAENLLAGGHKVRALVRNRNKAAAWESKGVELIEGDVTDAASLAGALRGVEAAFLMMPPNYAPQRGFPEAKAVVASYVEAIRQAQPPRLAVLSSIGSEKPERLGLITATHILEQGLAQFSSPIAFIRAGSFVENVLPQLGPAAQTGVLYSFYQPLDRPVPTIATRDIGALAAELMADSSWSGRRIIELGSPCSPNELASAMSEVLGRPVVAQPIPRDRWAATAESFGIPPESAWAYVEMVESINSGWIDFGLSGTERRPATTTPQQVFAAAQAAQR
jgi:uncharacterized protein YbjT (DUF2867 family)